MLSQAAAILCEASRTMGKLDIQAADLLNRHELPCVIVEAQVYPAKGTCSNHLTNLPVDLLTSSEPLHSA